MTKILESIGKYTLYIVVLLFPILPKLELLAAGASIFILLWVIRTLIKGKIIFAFGKFDLGVLLTATAYLLSAAVKTPNKMEAFFLPGTATFVILSAVLYFLINQFDKKVKNGISVAFFASGILLSLYLIFTQLGLLSKIPWLPALIRDPLFNPMGGSLTAGIYLLPLLLMGITFVIKEEDLVKKIFWGVSSAIVVMSAVLLIGSALPGKPQFPRFPSFQVSWEVAVGTLNKSPLFGIGPGNYLSAFNQFRPVSYNQTGLWQVRFTTGSDFYLTALTEVGLLGILALIILGISVYRYLRHNFRPEAAILLSLPVAFALFPASSILMFPLFAILGLFSESEKKIVTLTTISIGTGAKFAPRVPSFIIGVVLLAGAGIFDFFGIKAAIAEATFKKSLDALSKNDAKQTYNLMQKATAQNPNVDRYHASLAQIDMALAQSLASKKDIADSDRQAVTQLVQAAINEGKATVILNPERSGNWEILAQIYRSIMPFAQGADNFAIQTYTQAIALDPTNPNLRIALGGVFYALGRYDEAIEAFKLAVLAKPDLANAHYNLAIAYREKKNFDSAISEIKTVLSLVQKGSEDEKLAQKTLDELEKDKPAGSSDNLSAPQPKETSNIKPRIELPEDSTPPTTNQ